MSSVAGAVVTIDGDSSGLVGALQKGEKGLADVKQGARKLSDQLREVADDADTAAGALIQKVGGPTAVKAIAGIGVAFGAAKQGVEMFLDSSEKLFRSYGAQGQAVWDELEKQLFALQGTLAKTVLQTDDMYVASGRMNAGLELVSTIVDSVVEDIRDGFATLMKIPGFGIIPRKLGFYEALENFAKEGEAKSRELVANMEKVSKSFEKPIAPAKTLTEAISGMETAYAGLTGKSVSLEDQQRSQALANIDGTMKQIEALAMLQNLADNMSGDNLGTLSEEQEAMLTRLGKLRDEINANAKPAATVTPTGGGKKADATGVKEAADDTVYAFQLAEGGYAKLTKSQADFLLASETMLGDSSSRVMEMTQAEFDGQAALGDKMYLAEIDMQTKRAEAADKFRAEQAAKLKTEQDINEHEKAEYDARELKRVQDLEKAKADEQRAAMALVFNLAVIQSGKLLANAIVGNKKMGEVARAALGNVASGLGDVAMVKSAEYAAEGLYPQAAGMAVAGTLGYTIAAALGADKKANAGPPTERQQPVQNYAYNLRIDSAFADSESISRRFAQMQEGARQRGLITAAA